MIVWGGGRHALSTEVDFHEHEQQVFAHKLAEVLQEGHNNKAYDELAFVAPSRFLGVVNQEISPAVKKNIIQEVDSNLPERMNEMERIEHLRKYLDLWNGVKKGP